MIFKLIKYSLVDRLIQGAKLQNNREICKFNPILFLLLLFPLFNVSLSPLLRLVLEETYKLIEILDDIV